MQFGNGSLGDGQDIFWKEYGEDSIADWSLGEAQKLELLKLKEGVFDEEEFLKAREDFASGTKSLEKKLEESEKEMSESWSFGSKELF